MRYSPLIFLIAIGCTPSGKPVPPKVDVAKDFDSLYAANCAGCHGADGKNGPAPPLEDHTFLLSVQSDPEFHQVIAIGRPGTAMPAFARKNGGPLTDEQIDILYKGLIRNSPEVLKDAEFPFDGAYKKDGNTERGKLVYAKACATCHGANGEGGTFDSKPIGAINIAAFLALCSDRFLWRIIITGRPDLGMPSYSGKTGRAADYQALTPQDANDLTAYLASWRNKP